MYTDILIKNESKLGFPLKTFHTNGSCKLMNLNNVIIMNQAGDYLFNWLNK